MTESEQGRELLGAATVLTLAFVGYRLWGSAAGTGTDVGQVSTLWAYRLGGAAALAALGLLHAVLMLSSRYFDRIIAPLLLRWKKIGAARVALLTAVSAIPAWFMFGPFPGILAPVEMRFLLILVSALWIGTLAPIDGAGIPEKVGLVFLGLVSIHAIIWRSVLVSDYPFKLSWSEGNRHWDHSLFFERYRYEIVGDFNYPSYITPGRHGLWGLIFLVPGVSIAAARAWDVILWTLPYLLLGYMLFWHRGRGKGPRWLQVGWILWGFLFLSQGPIYAPLVLSALLLAWGYRRENLVSGLVVTAIACFYAGISRWTWLLAPGIWAAVWAVMDSDPTTHLLQRLVRPALYGFAGLIGAAASQALMAVAFPRQNPIYSTAASQDLLWYRLWPSATNPTGIVPGMLIALFPVMIFLIWLHVRGHYRWDLLQVLAGLAGLAAFAGVGLVASVKIGGGNNLHNLDMLLVGLVMVVALAFVRSVGLASNPDRFSLRVTRVIGALLIAIPGWFVLKGGMTIELPSRTEVRHAMESVQQTVRERAASGQVLFIDQRQLFTFGQVDDVPLVMDYELKHLMNMAMSDNRPYLDEFETDLASHRFNLIVVHPLNRVMKGRDSPFGEENDAWVRNVSVPLLEYYEPIAEHTNVDIWLMAPKAGE